MHRKRRQRKRYAGIMKEDIVIMTRSRIKRHLTAELYSICECVISQVAICFVLASLSLCSLLSPVSVCLSWRASHLSVVVSVAMTDVVLSVAAC